jgi:hypothetical protein
MGKVKTKNHLPPFVPLTWDLLNHAAYRDLKPSAAKALPYFLGKYQVYSEIARDMNLNFTFLMEREEGSVSPPGRSVK